MTLLDRIQIATGIPDWEPLSAAEPDALFCVWSDRRWRVERMSEEPERWEVEIRRGPAGWVFVGADLERTLADAMGTAVLATHNGGGTP